MDGGSVAHPLRSFQFASAITAISRDDGWAVGVDKTRRSRTLAAHWNGTTWSVGPTPNITNAGNAQNELTAISAHGADDVWASGFADNVTGHNFRLPYVLHWDGKGEL